MNITFPLQEIPSGYANRRTFISATHDVRICVREDGCVDIDTVANGYSIEELDAGDPSAERNADYLHICNLENWIQGLGVVQQLTEGWREE